MKHNKTRNSLPAVAGILGTMLATAPLAESASISPEEALEEVFAAEITGSGTWTDRVYGERSWLTFAGVEAFVYEVHTHTAPDSWTLLGTAEVINGQGLFVIDAGYVNPDDCEVFLTLHGESEPPRWPDGSSFAVVSVKPDGVEVAWDEAADDQGVAGYAVYMNGEAYATMGPRVRNIVIDGLEPGQTAELDLLALDEQGQCAQHPVTLAICAGTHLPTAPIDEAKAVFGAYLDVLYDPTLATVVTKQPDSDLLLAYMYNLTNSFVTSYNGIADRSAQPDAARIKKEIDICSPDISARARVDVNGDSHVSPLDALRIANRAANTKPSRKAPVRAGISKSMDMASSPLNTESVWDDTDIAHVITTDWDFTTYDSALGLVGLPPGIGLTFQAADANENEVASLVPLPLPTGALETTALVGLPPGIGLTFQATDADENAEELKAAGILLPAVQHALQTAALTDMPVSGESFAAFREYSLPVIVYATFMSQIGPHVDGVLLSGSSAGGAGVRTNLDADSLSEDVE